MVGVKGQVFWW